MGLLPAEYYDAIRGPVFRQLGLSDIHAKSERIYISRAKAGKRRVLNEDALVSCLEKYGFRRVFLEELSFRQSVELFHKAEIVVGPHGAGLGTMFFSGDISLVVLYATQAPPNYFHSLAVGLRQRHHFVRHHEAREDDNFTADLPALEAVLQNELHLTPKT
jgi:capsular polysaccharide biosynthesis protein